MLTAETASPKLTRNVAPGIHRLAHAYVNCYLVEELGQVSIVDAALPATWPLLPQALTAIGRRMQDVAALVITHAHFDHLGFARKAVDELEIPVWVHPLDRHTAEHPYSYRRERTPFVYPALYPRAVPVLWAMTAAGALNVEGVREIQPLPASGTLEVPGHPTAVFTPGHTAGHCALHFTDRDAVITGDALVTLDPYKGAPGAQIIAGAATADSAEALRSLNALARTEARIVLPGHGAPWRDGVRAAVAAARAVGAS
jgi:glyoxylase-like metal-dependent hydrolase (beta-lactamase superfamily II)